MALKAVIFDMDDTLIDWSQHDADRLEVRRAHLRSVYEHLKSAGHSLPDLDGLAEVHIRILIERWTSVAAPDWVAPRYLDILRDTLLELGLDTEALDRWYPDWR